jgi:hypothetical protein
MSGLEESSGVGRPAGHVASGVPCGTAEVGRVALRIRHSSRRMWLALCAQNPRPNAVGLDVLRGVATPAVCCTPDAGRLGEARNSCKIATFSASASSQDGDACRRRSRARQRARFAAGPRGRDAPAQEAFQMIYTPDNVAGWLVGGLVGDFDRAPPRFLGSAWRSGEVRRVQKTKSDGRPPPCSFGLCTFITSQHR